MVLKQSEYPAGKWLTLDQFIIPVYCLNIKTREILSLFFTQLFIHHEVNEIDLSPSGLLITFESLPTNFAKRHKTVYLQYFL